MITNVPRRKPVMSKPGTLDLPQIPPRPSPRTSTSFDSSHRRPLPQPPAQNCSGNHQHEAHDTHDPTETAAERQLRSDLDFTPPAGQPILSLTLIRRDPGSGAQWNVAKIYDPPVQEISSESLSSPGAYRAKRSGAPLFIDISNPGYSKFLDSQRPVSSYSTGSSSLDSNGQADGVFRRRLWMDGSRFADHAYTHRKQSSVDKGRSSLHLDPRDLHISPRAVVDRRSKGYTFRSPWDGKCEFATGVSGRSLKVSSFAFTGVDA